MSGGRIRYAGAARAISERHLLGLDDSAEEDFQGGHLLSGPVRTVPRGVLGPALAAGRVVGEEAAIALLHGSGGGVSQERRDGGFREGRHLYRRRHPAGEEGFKRLLVGVALAGRLAELDHDAVGEVIDGHCLEDIRCSIRPDWITCLTNYELFSPSVPWKQAKQHLHS